MEGFSDVQAARLYKDGCRTLDDLRKPEYYKTLKASVRVSLDYVDHLDKGVTRQESEAVMVSRFLSTHLIILANLHVKGYLEVYLIS